MRRIAVLFVTACFLAAGCAKSEPGKGASGKPIEIVMWLVGSEDQAITVTELAQDFYNKTGIKVRCDAISWGDAHSKYLTSIAGGMAPDIGTMGLTWGAEFGNLRSMVDLRQSHGPEIEEMKRGVFPGLWRSIECNGRIYGIPFDMTEYVLYYRNDIVAKPPATWSELESTLSGLGKASKGMIFDWGSLGWIGYSPFLWQAGGDYYNADNTESVINTPACVTALDFFAGLYKKYNVPKTKIPLEQGMRTGDFPLAISGNWKIDGLRLLAPEITGKWKIAMLPAGPTGKRTSFIGGRIMGIFEQSRYKEAAWEFIKYLFTPEVQAKLYEAALTKQDTYLPPSKNTWNILKMDPKFKEVLVAQAQDAKGPPPVAKWDASARYVDEAIQKVILQNGDAKKELDAAKTRLDRMLKR